MTNTQANNSNRTYILIGIFVLLVALVVGGYFAFANTLGRLRLAPITGAGYTAGGDLTLATNDGLWRLSDTGWQSIRSAQDAYIGYSVTQNGFYASGFGTSDSPLGLQRSIDSGNSITTVRFAEDRAFPQISAAYQNTNVIYIYTTEVNDDFAFGLHYSLDGGITWQRSIMADAPATLFDIAVHPTDEAIVAIATGDDGAFLSRDYGDTFVRISNAPTVSVAFDPINPDRLYFAFQVLTRYTLSDGTLQDIGTPIMTPDEAVIHIAGNPLSDAVTLVTSENDVYQWDGIMGGQWRELVAAGMAQ
ncbi:MAG: hypothetical protein AAFQ07_06390 [Chloroflexota bacterium]